MKKFHHLGLVAKTEMPGETYYDSLKVWGTDPENDPNRVEWVRFAPDSPLADTPLARMPHISYAVDDLNEELSGLEPVVGPLDVGEGIRIAYVMIDDALIEYFEAK
jgi:glyoxylase I family protein